MMHTVLPFTCIQYASIMPFNIMLHTVRKHYAIQYHAAYSTQALCHSISCCIQYMQQYTSIMPFNIKLHIQYASIMLFNIMHICLCHSIYAACSTQALCCSISCCIQYASIMPFNIMLHTVRKHYAIQYHAAYSMQAL